MFYTWPSMTFEHNGTTYKLVQGQQGEVQCHRSLLTMHSASVHFEIPGTRWPRFFFAALSSVASAGAVAGGGAGTEADVAAAP